MRVFTVDIPSFGGRVQDPFGLTALAVGALVPTPSSSKSSAIDGNGFSSIDYSILLEDAGGGAALVTLFVQPQFSTLLEPDPAADEDWQPDPREEFETDATPTGDGTSVLSDYTASQAIGPGDLPRRVSVSVPLRGRWQRVVVYGDGTTAHINRTVDYIRRP